MIHFIIGVAGTGKTTRLLEEINRSVQSGRRAILLIPEQFSFEGEKLIYDTLGPSLSLGVEVLSFTRLCNSIFRSFGGLAGTEVTQTAKYLLMSLALDEVRDKLTIYNKSSQNTSFLESMLSVCSEFKTAGATPQLVAERAALCVDGELNAKLSELSVIYAAYQAMLEQGYSDPEDCLIRACAILREVRFFSGCDVFVDAFTAFMSGEYMLLEHIIKQSEHVWFTLPADTLNASSNGLELFAPSNAALKNLIRRARRLDIPIAAPEVLAAPKKYADPALAFLAANYLKPGQEYGEKSNAIHLYTSTDPYGEAEYTAMAIDNLVRGGVLYRDIAVVARDISAYTRAMELSFGRYGIPCFISDPEDIENKPLTAALLSAIDAVRVNYSAQPILMLAKSPAIGLDAESVSELENYCYAWGITGHAWLREFTGSPRGLADGMTEEDDARLGRINKTRAALIAPLERLREKVRTGIGAVFAGGIYDFLIEMSVPDNLTRYAEIMPSGEKEAFLDEGAQLWDILMGILDVFGQVAGERRIPWQRLCDLFRLAACTAELATPPQTLDAVIAGNADRIRPGSIKYCFVIGANEGVFPPPAISGGVFSDAEREALTKIGLELSGLGLRQVLMERYYTYFALTLPSEGLTVTYAASDLHGRAMQPSIIVSGLVALYPKIIHNEKREWPVSGKDAAFRMYAERHMEGTAFTKSLEAFLLESGYGHILERLGCASRKAPHGLEKQDLPGELFGRSLRLSPSKVERFHKCPYSFFISDGLKLAKRRKVEFSPLESGGVIHHVLQVMVQKYGGSGLAGLDVKELEEEIRGIIAGYASDRTSGAELPVRFRYLLERLCGTLARLLLHMGREFAQSKFSPEEFEMPIRFDSEVRPLSLETLDGAPITVEGIVDRVDVMRAGKSVYVRVVDYKSGRRDFKLQDIMAGLNLQMLLYLFTISENGAGRFCGEVIPAGVLYMPVHERFITAPRIADEGEVAREREKNWKMSGLLLDDELCLRGMEADMAGVFIPAKIKKDGTLDGKSALAGLAQMGRLADKVKREIKTMGDALMSGVLPSRPVRSDDYPTCDYCDYRAVCGFEEGDPVREIAKMDRETVLRLLEQEES